MVFLAIPIVGCGVLVAVGGTRICKRLGIAITAPMDKQLNDKN